MSEKNITIKCKTCPNVFESPVHLDEGEEHPDQCPECPPVDENGKLY